MTNRDGDYRTECDCIYCKDMKEIQQFHANGGYPQERYNYGKTH